MFSKNKEYILCAAIWYDDNIERIHLPKNIRTGIVVFGWRHANCISQLKLMFYDNYKEDKSHNEIRINVLKNSTQGFLTSNGNFVDRNTAGRIAFESGQCEILKTLYSEDLY